MVEIIPAILSKSPDDYHKKFKAVEPFTDWIQVDIVDNKFARNQTIDSQTVKSFQTTKKLEIHLMVDFIEDWVDPFIEIKVERLIVPLESARDSLNLINHLKRHAVPMGFSLNPETPVERLQHVIDKVDTVLLLSVHPGFTGQHFVYGTLEKIRQVRAMRPDIPIEIDGGVEPGTAKKCAQIGANILVAGSYIFENDMIEAESYQDKVKLALENLRDDVANVSPILEG